MSREFRIGAGDTARALFVRSYPPLNFSAALQVLFDTFDLDRALAPALVNRPAAVANGTYVIDGQSVSFTPADGVLFYQWASAAETAAGNFGGRFRVEFPGTPTKWLSVPGDGLIPLIFK